MNPLGEVENQCTLHDFIVLAIFVPRIIKFGKHVTKLLEHNFDSFFLWHGVEGEVVFKVLTA